MQTTMAVECDKSNKCTQSYLETVYIEQWHSTQFEQWHSTQFNVVSLQDGDDNCRW